MTTIALEDLRKALAAIHSGGAPRLRDILLLAAASEGRAFVPAAVSAAVAAKYAVDGNLANGGMDQVAWNAGAASARATAQAWYAIGAIENATLLARLASELEDHLAFADPEAVKRDAVGHFLAFRRRVQGPFFAVPDLDEEIADALTSFVARHRATIPKASDV